MSIPEGQLYYDSLMELYASWGVDFIKVDDIAYSTIYRDSHKVFERPLIKRDGRLYFPFHRDRQDFRMEAFSKRMPICGDLQTISGMSGNCFMICSIVVIIGRHLSVKETGLIAICFRLDILESVPVSVERQTV